MLAKHNSRCLYIACLCLLASGTFSARADELALRQTGADVAAARYGATGKGVVVAILDRGIEWQNPDFIKPDGTTRIKYMLDMSGQNYCNAGNPKPIEYTAAQINAALAGGPTIPERDAVGHGTVTAGIAAGNGRAFAGGKYTGFAPDADLIIVKLTSDGVPAYTINGTNYPGEAAFTACHTQALAWLDRKLKQLKEPAVALINSGVQLWGPIDGTSIVSRTIDQYFKDIPGRIYISASGDEGNLPTHAGGHFNTAAERAVIFTRASGAADQMAIWYSGQTPAQITLSLGDGTVVGPVAPPTTPPWNEIISADGLVSVTQFYPGYEFYPATSTSGDRFVNIYLSGHGPVSGTVEFHALGRGSAKFDIYTGTDVVDYFPTNELATGRLTDWSSTFSANSVGAHVLRNTYVDINGNRQTIAGDTPGALWVNSAGGPTRDGRLGIAVTAPGENIFASYGTTSYWETFQFNLIQGGGGWYGRQGATSGASPIAVGAAAMMLQLNPALTSEAFNALITKTASRDGFTGRTPNIDWGYGKINILGAIEKMCQTARC
jgi:hypothetical protein